MVYLAYPIYFGIDLWDDQIRRGQGDRSLVPHHIILGTQRQVPQTTINKKRKTCRDFSTQSFHKVGQETCPFVPSDIKQA